MVNGLLKFLIIVVSASLLYSYNVLAFEKHKYAALVVDSKNGKILYEENATKQRYPASITKVMTLYLTFEALAQGKITMDQLIPVSRHAASMPPIKLGLKPGSKIKVRDAVYAAAIRSANDAAVALTEAIAGSEANFVKLMNQRARDLGMKQTHYTNASGLPDNPNNISSAYDIAKIAIAIERDYPEYFKIFQHKEFIYKGKPIKTTNHLLGKYKYPGVTGLKTGFINKSGYNLVTTVKRGDRKLVAVVLGGNTGVARDKRMMALLDKFLEGTNNTFQETILAKKTDKIKKKIDYAKNKAGDTTKQGKSAPLSLANAKVSEKKIRAVKTKLSDNRQQSNKKIKVVQN